MKIILALTSILIFVFSLLPSHLYAAANTYYVTQNGLGDRSGGSRSHAWSVSDFNSPANWSDKDNSAKIDPGDTVYFSGKITAELKIKGSGTAGNYITLDGLEGGDYDALGEGSDGQAVIDRVEDLGYFGISLWTRDLRGGGGADYIIIQDFEIKEIHAGIRLLEDSDHIIIRRNFIHDGSGYGIYIGYHPVAGFRNGCNNITIGGALGEGNSIKNITMGTAGGDIVFTKANDIIVSYNHLYATKSAGLITDRGVDGVVPMDGSYNWLIEYNSIHSHNDNYHSDPLGDCQSCKGKGEDGIDIKSDGAVGPGVRNGIIRYNHIYDHQNQSNLTIQTCTNNVYVYGNLFHESDWGITLKANCKDPSIALNNIYFFSNIIYKEEDSGVRSYRSQSGVGLPFNMYFFNNTFAENATDNTSGSPYSQMYLAHTDPERTYIYNNIFFESRPNHASYQGRQIYLNPAMTEIDYNHYFTSTKKSTIFINGKSANAIGGHIEIETNGQEGDPGLADLDNNDYRIRAGAAVIGKGVDMGSGAIATITIQGRVYPVYWDIAIGPNTIWGFGANLPVVEVVHRDSVGWDKGAYAHAEGHFAQPSIEPPSELRILTR